MFTKAFVLAALFLGLQAQDLYYGSYQQHKNVVDNDFITLDVIYDHDVRWYTFYQAFE